MHVLSLCVGVILMFGVGAYVIAAEKSADKSGDKPAATTKPAPAVPVNKKCPVTGEDVNPKGKTVTYKGKVVGFCCDDCIDLFNKNPDKYADKIK